MNLGGYGVPRRSLPDFPVMASVYLSTNQSVANATETKVAYDTVEFDFCNLWDAVNKRFVIPVKGVYRYTQVVQGQGATSTAGLQLSVHKNGPLNRYMGLIQYNAANQGASTQFNASVLLSLVQGDYIEGNAWLNCAGAPTLSGSASPLTYQQIELVRAT